MTTIEKIARKLDGKIDKDVELVIKKSDKKIDHSLGDLIELTIDSPKFSSYVFEWGNGVLEFCVVNAVTYEDEISVQVYEVNDDNVVTIITERLLTFFQSNRIEHR